MRERIKIWIFWIFTKIFEYILNRSTAFLCYVDTGQLPRQMPSSVEKKRYHAGKKVAHASFVWHPDTLFQPTDISVHLSLVENAVKHIHFQGYIKKKNCLLQSCLLYFYFFFLADLNSLDTIFAERTCYLFFTAQKMNFFHWGFLQ